MKGKEVGKDRNQRGSITNQFIFIRGIRFLFNGQLGMILFKVRVIDKGNVADDAKPVGKDGELVGIVEMAVDVHPLVKSIAENGRDKFLDIKMFIKELEERGASSTKMS